LCSMTALHLASENGNTETAMALVELGADVHFKSNDGYGSRASSLCGCVAHSARRTVRPLREECQECRFGLCRRTALHFASEQWHPETAMALVKAGADVHCKSNDGYCARFGTVRGPKVCQLGA
jgi:ankyrin repeat protein